jgi:hypothetical protein
VGEEFEVTLPGGGSSRFRVTSVEEMPVLPEDPEHTPDGARRTKYRVFGVAVTEPIEGVYR